MKLTPEEIELVELDRRRKQRTGKWWLTPDGIEYARDCFDEDTPPIVYLNKIEELTAENIRFQSVLLMVEWRYVEDVDEERCPWCSWSIEQGHAPDCARQIALNSKEA